MTRYNRQLVDDDNRPFFVNGNPALVKQAETIGEGSRYGVLTVPAEIPTPIRLGETNLEERHSVLVINLGSSPIYVGFDDAVTDLSGIPIRAEQERMFSLNHTESLTLYAFSKTEMNIRVVEVK